MFLYSYRTNLRFDSGWNSLCSDPGLEAPLKAPEKK
jgi:hypothetical protein